MTKTPTIYNALLSLCPNSQWTIDGDTYDSISWNEIVDPIPTEQQVNDEIERLKETFDYKRNRINRYPSIADQLDMLWHAMDNGVLPKVNDFYETIKQIKNEYPKTTPAIRKIAGATGPTE